MKKLLTTITLIILTLVIIVINAIYINPNSLKIRTETIHSSKLQSEFKLVVFSDLLYRDNQAFMLDKVVDNINALSPDMVLFLGDLAYDLNYNYINSKLLEINATYKYFILGENDSDDIKQLLISSNFIQLNNDYKSIYLKNNDVIKFIPIDFSNFVDDMQIMSLNSNEYNIVISHMPDSVNFIAKNSNVDYMIAGHGLGSTINLPIINKLFESTGANDYISNKHFLKGFTLDITNGVGYKNNKFRLNCDPEIVVYKFSK